MRVRIASTKATQKITKAMQMVAASKLRRAQAAAEAARPYAEHMEKMLGNIAAALAGSDGGPKLLVGTGKDNVHLLVVCTAERGLCGAFNTNVHRATVARWIVRLKQQIFDEAVRVLRARLSLDTAEVESLCRAVQSQLDFSLGGLLET